jgi:hypothetical protein
MRRVRQAVLAAGLAMIGACSAQTYGALGDPGTAALKDGPLVVWLVWPGTAEDRARIYVRTHTAVVRLPTAVVEQTTGEFGQPSSNVGQTSGTYGQASGGFGQASSNVGQTAGNYGTAASNVGRSAGDHGQTAGSYGQTAGSFGQPSSSFGDGLSAPLVGATSTGNTTIRERERVRFLQTVTTAFPDLQIRFVEVVADELKERLVAAEHSRDFPDLVVGTTLPDWWDGSGFGLSMLGGSSFLDAGAEIRFRPEWRPEKVVILAQAPHIERARALVVWLSNELWCGSCLQITGGDAAVDAGKVAVSALGTVLQGDGLGAQGDPEIAQFSAEMARGLALMPTSSAALDDLKYRIDVLSGRANDRLAVVTLRAIASSPQAFGVLRAKVALRKNDKGQWKVLQISPNVSDQAVGWLGPEDSPSKGWELLATYTDGASADKVTGISQAAPVDGDNRSPQPDLWWDDGSGAAALAVEWQIKLGAWTDSRMVIFPDRNPRLQTRVTARFARMSGQYRWRVWSVGRGGAVHLSPWRTLNITR